MSNYTKATNFATKDTLPTGDSGKIVKGTEIDSEFNAIASAISSKADTASPTFTGTPLTPTAIAGTNNTQIASTAFVKTAVDNALTAEGFGTLSTQDADDVEITGGTITGITDLTVADGGTGASSITANSVILGNGTSALSGNLVAPGTSGNVLTSNGTTWASSTPAVLNGGQIFTSSGTFTVPAGVTSVRVALIGGGGGGGSSTGTYGVAGGSSSFGSYCTAGGGGPGHTQPGDGGSASGGTLNISGNAGSQSVDGGGGAGGKPSGFVEGQDYYGRGGAGAGEGDGGGSGGYCVEYITGLTPGATISVTVGAGGAGGTGVSSGNSGIAGIVSVQW
jgi:hypothetical protein